LYKSSFNFLKELLWFCKAEGEVYPNAAEWNQELRRINHKLFGQQAFLNYWILHQNKTMGF